MRPHLHALANALERTTLHQAQRHKLQGSSAVLSLFIFLRLRGPRPEQELLSAPWQASAVQGLPGDLPEGLHMAAALPRHLHDKVPAGTWLPRGVFPSGKMVVWVAGPSFSPHKEVSAFTQPSADWVRVVVPLWVSGSLSIAGGKKGKPQRRGGGVGSQEHCCPSAAGEGDSKRRPWLAASQGLGCQQGQGHCLQ